MNCPMWLYRFLDRHGWNVRPLRLIWPYAHYCNEMDGLLVLENVTDCFCGFAPDADDLRELEMMKNEASDVF